MIVVHMSNEEFEQHKDELDSKYYKHTIIPSWRRKPNRHDYYAKNGKRMLTVFEPSK